MGNQTLEKHVRIPPNYFFRMFPWLRCYGFGALSFALLSQAMTAALEALGVFVGRRVRSTRVGPWGDHILGGKGTGLENFRRRQRKRKKFKEKWRKTSLAPASSVPTKAPMAVTKVELPHSNESGRCLSRKPTKNSRLSKSTMIEHS